jgi:hypothetical protein
LTDSQFNLLGIRVVWTCLGRLTIHSIHRTMAKQRKNV